MIEVVQTIDIYRTFKKGQDEWVVMDRLDSGGLHTTPIQSFEEGWELLETANDCASIKGSAVFQNGHMVAFRERGKRAIDLRLAT